MLMIGKIYKITTITKLLPQHWKQEKYIGLVIGSELKYLELLDKDRGYIKIEKEQLFEAEELGKKNGNVNLF